MFLAKLLIHTYALGNGETVPLKTDTSSKARELYACYERNYKSKNTENMSAYQKTIQDELDKVAGNFL